MPSLFEKPQAMESSLPQIWRRRTHSQKHRSKTQPNETLIAIKEEWNAYYNNLEHCSLDGKTPNEVLFLTPFGGIPSICFFGNRERKLL